MRWLLKLVLQMTTNSVAIFIAAYFLPQLVSFTGDWLDYLFVGSIITVANIIARPILKVISAPLIFITMGLFLVVINAAILFAVDWFIEALSVHGILGYVLVSLITSIVNTIILGSFGKKKID